MCEIMQDGWIKCFLLSAYNSLNFVYGVFEVLVIKYIALRSSPKKVKSLFFIYLKYLRKIYIKYIKQYTVRDNHERHHTENFSY